MKRSYQLWLRLAALTLCCGLILSVATGCCFCVPASLQEKLPQFGANKAPALKEEEAVASRVTTMAVQENTTATTTTAAPIIAPTIATTTAPRQEALVMYVVAKDGLRMRETPFLNSEVILIIPNESQVLVLKEQDDWYYVRYKTAEGWCSVDWIFPSIASASTAPQAKGDAAVVLNGIEKANDTIRTYRDKYIATGLTNPNPSEQEILDLYFDAQALLNDAVNQPLSHLFRADGDGETYYDGYAYWQPGRIYGYDSFAALCTAYYACLSNDLAYECLKDEFALIDGQLYGHTAGMQDGHVPYDVTHSAVKDGNRYLVVDTVVWDYGVEQVTQTVTHICEYEDGNWVFTSITALP